MNLKAAEACRVRCGSPACSLRIRSEAVDLAVLLSEDQNIWPGLPSFCRSPAYSLRISPEAIGRAACLSGGQHILARPAEFLLVASMLFQDQSGGRHILARPVEVCWSPACSLEIILEAIGRTACLSGGCRTDSLSIWRPPGGQLVCLEAAGRMACLSGRCWADSLSIWRPLGE